MSVKQGGRAGVGQTACCAVVLFGWCDISLSGLVRVVRLLVAAGLKALK